jgi:two-component system, LuxR family, sensor kinase FixL
MAGFVIAYLALELISFIHEYKGLPLTPWNPGLGLAFACLILIGPHYGIALFVAIIIAEIVVLRSNLEWTVIVAIAAIIASSYASVATVIREQFRLDVGLAHLRDVIILLGAGFIGATGVTLLLEHFPAQLNRGILVGARIGESIGIDSAWGGGRCRKPILGTCDSA